MELAALSLYLMVCVITAVAVGYERTLGFGFSLVFCVFLTPLIGAGISLLFPRLPKACCMRDYKDFSTGLTYHFKLTYLNGAVYYDVQHANTYRLTADEFNKYFAVVVNNPGHLEKIQALKN